MSPPAWLFQLIEKLEWAIIGYFVVVNVVYIVLFGISLAAILHYFRLQNHRDIKDLLKSHMTPPISVLVPAYNESANITVVVRSLLHLHYPELEIVVINDGSSDDTLNKLIETFKLKKTSRHFPKKIPTADVLGIYATKEVPPWVRLVVVDKKNGGKSDALNAGLNVSRYPLFCSVDADSILEQDSLLRVVMPFTESKQSLIAVGGVVRVANGCRIVDGVVESVGLSSGWLPRIQAVEYIRAFFSGRIAWSKLKCLLVVSGAFSVFRKSAVMDVKGYRTDTVGEDMELVVRLHHFRRKWGLDCRIEIIPDPVCWTEVPETFAMLCRQRNRWERGLGQSLALHRDLLFNPKYPRLGFLAMPYFLFVEFLSPVVESFGYILFTVAFFSGALDWHAMGAFFLLAVLMGINLSLLAVLLEEFALHKYSSLRNLFRLLGAAILENLGYRQIVNIARLIGIVEIFKRDQEWGHLKRRGLNAKA